MFDCNAIAQQYGEAYWREFAFFSANVQQVLGVCDTAVQFELYTATKEFGKRQAMLDLREVLDHPILDLGDLLPIAPCFLATFHYGYYRLLPLLLLQQGRRIAVIVSDDALADQQLYYATVMEQCWADTLVFVRAEDTHLFFKIRKLVARGYDILCYMDGGTGVGRDHAPDTKYTRIKLAGAAVRARKGALDMAYLLALPVYMLRSEVDPRTDIVALSIEAIGTRDRAISRETFVVHTLQKLYDALGRAIQWDSRQWEGWLYMHRDMKPQSQLDCFEDQCRFIPFQLYGGYFLLDKMCYGIYPLDGRQYAIAWQKFGYCA
ncbi:hypothetical protein [Sphingobacterium faecale]|uniref:Lauroyl/myristoyl acyltransferase n=1 Tax=Sphingobacterium faecale TaxID=2803775 RepID=A0ABS1R0S7_9SPHI|nr:hypothetical protein [Sphingobacterium faecale]MBL1407647.1 hypothetical protein [Sphingobacterium faecale]